MTPYRLPSILEAFQNDQLTIKRVHDLLEGLAKNARRSLAKFVVNVNGTLFVCKSLAQDFGLHLIKPRF